MIRFFRPYLPLVIAVLCWLFILLVPATRQGVVTAWNNRFGVTPESDEVEMVPGWSKNSDAGSLLRRFPGDEKVELYAAVGKDASKWLERHPQNAVFVAFALEQQVETLKFSRIEGPLTNSNYPAPPSQTSPSSPKAEWDRFIALARRGQRLEPDNTFFDWMLLYGLYETRQDALAREVLSKAAHKTAFDDHSREAILNRLEVLRLVYGTPLSPRELYSVWTLMGISHYGKMRQCSRWVMEGVIADRGAGRHSQALSAAMDLMHLTRVMRREEYSLIGSLVGTACEGIALSAVNLRSKTAASAPRPRVGDPLSKFQSHPQMLYFYAKSQKRSDITRVLDKEWVEMGQWRNLSNAIIDKPWTGNSTAQTLTITASERLASLIVKALPSILVLGLLFAWLSRRFRDDTDRSEGLPSGVLRHGICFGTGLWLLALLCDVTMALRSGDASSMLDVESQLMFGEGLLVDVPSWVIVGIAGAVLCLGVNRAVTWQKREAGKIVSLRSRLKTALDAPEDGLARFDFGWLFGLALQLTGWFLLVGGLWLFSFQLREISSEFSDSLGFSNEGIGCLLMATAIVISLLFSLNAWRKLSRSRQTSRLGLRIIARSFLGFFVLTTVLYAATVFAVLPFSLRYDRQFQSAMERGEVAIARSQLGL